MYSWIVAEDGGLSLFRECFLGRNLYKKRALTTHLPWRAVPGENTESTEVFLRVFLGDLCGKKIWLMCKGVQTTKLVVFKEQNLNANFSNEANNAKKFAPFAQFA